MSITEVVNTMFNKEFYIIELAMDGAPSVTIQEGFVYFGGDFGSDDIENVLDIFERPDVYRIPRFDKVCKTRQMDITNLIDKSNVQKRNELEDIIEKLIVLGYEIESIE